MRQPDTGESTAAINKRRDDANEPLALEALRAGATLTRPSRLRDYYVDRGEGPSSTPLTSARIKKLERDGTIVRVGVDRYGIGGKS